MKHPQPCLALVLTLAALAAPGLAGARQLGNGGTTFSSLSQQTAPEAFLDKFVELAHADLLANTMLLDALGVPATARTATAALAALDMQASTADIANASAAAGATHQLVTQALATGRPLDDASKSSFASGALALCQAAQDFTALSKNIGATKQALNSAGMPARVALQASRYTPEVAAQLRAELKAVVAFAQANQVSLASAVKEAAAAL